MSDDVKERLAKAREAKAKKDEAVAAAKAARELQVLELEEGFEREIGPRGVDFEIIETVEGPVVVKRGEAVLHTRFQGAKEINDTAIHDYVFPCVMYPAKEKYLEIVNRRPGIALRCASALATLFGVKAEADAGKF